jgi:hypothetical protein
MTITPTKGSSFLDHHISIAGNYVMGHGRTLDPTITNLKKINGREGVRLELHGGKHPFNDKHGEKQVAIIDFICDPDRTGLEGLESDGGDKKMLKAREAELSERQQRRSPADDDEKDGDNDGDDSKKEKEDTSRSLRFKSYGHDEDRDADALRLEWYTKYACDAYEGHHDTDGGSHWGFFTWFIVL